MVKGSFKTSEMCKTVPGTERLVKQLDPAVNGMVRNNFNDWLNGFSDWVVNPAPATG